MSDNEKPVEEETPVLTKKDPKKAAQGKRLAMISKEAKERKMRQCIEKEKEENRSYLEYAPIAVSVLSTLGLFFTLYLLFKGGSKETLQEKEKDLVGENEETPSNPQTNTNTSNKRRFEEL